eukprot:TRINITY_DN8861_c0_g2_i1.p1 TRINITY_DN8861_c0_g2~~TRINITY_DN8861_c0_g2_i1.p1  ORF type:complete len:291 (+),score=102.57 TRINITY_DN8861_c0_g2_i1:102-974(+)
MAQKRVAKEYSKLLEDPIPGVYVLTEEKNPLRWQGAIEGPEGSPYEGGLFEVSINIPADYPFQPPRVKFATKIFHCNVYTSNDICLDILDNKWSPALTLGKVLLSLRSLLTEPNPSSPANPEAARALRARTHDPVARDWTKKYASRRPQWIARAIAAAKAGAAQGAAAAEEQKKIDEERKRKEALEAEERKRKEVEAQKRREAEEKKRKEAEEKAQREAEVQKRKREAESGGTPRGKKPAGKAGRGAAKSAAAPAPAAAAAAGAWACKVCTFENKPMHLACDMCGTERAG